MRIAQVATYKAHRIAVKDARAEEIRSRQVRAKDTVYMHLFVYVKVTVLRSEKTLLPLRV